MRNYIIKLSGLFVACLLVLPTNADAYATTKQTAVRLSDHSALFTITYRFGFLNRELKMPIGVQRGAFEPASPYAHVALLADSEDVSNLGTVAGIVLTDDEDVTVVDDEYYLPAGEAAEFTLVALVTLPDPLPEGDLDLALNVSHLPFTMIKDGTPISARLNPSELQYYTTPEIDFRDQFQPAIKGAVHTLMIK